MILQVFVKRSGDRVLDGSHYRVRYESRPQPLPETRGASSVIVRMARQLSDRCPRDHAA